jgi:FlaA1/EpsC-like NDP-sugar epimerase
MQKVFTSFNSLRTLLLLVLYVLVLSTSFYVAYDLRFDFAVPVEAQAYRLFFLGLSVMLKLVLLVMFRQFGSLLSYFSIPDLLRITVAMGITSLLFNILWLVSAGALAPPRGVILADFVLSVTGLCSARLAMRLFRERFLANEGVAAGKSRRVVVLGAGDVGASLVGEALRRPALGLTPVFFLDDNRSKHGLQIHGVPVLGAVEDIGKLMEEHRVEAGIIAMPTANGRRVQEIYQLFAAQGLKVEIVPSLGELTSGRVQVTKIRPVEMEDLLGRDSVDLRSDEVGALVRDKVVLVTGAGGSIGTELCRQLAAYNPKRLLLVEQAEGSLFVIESELNDRGHRSLIVPLVADILDLPRMSFIFDRYSPQIVFHAAAHKHVYMMERQPGEAVKNNTKGSRQLAELASQKGIEAFILISTDKAINPTSAMGASKRLAEMHLLAVQAQPANRTRFFAVRFGNVLGSSGSVIPIFKRQIAAGGPVTVTHPDVTRYFMTIPEAVGLVLRTVTLGQGGEIFVLNMGKPVKIVDLARQVIEFSGLRPDADIEIKFIGLRPGEKLYEELQHHTELLKPTAHDRIHLLAASAPPSAAWVRDCCGELEELAGVLDPNQLKLVIKKFVPEYTPHLD